MSAASPALARQVIASLMAAGVRHVVVCPGSRNAPLLQAAHRAEQMGLLTLHVRIDERSAGFVALGLALSAGSSREPVAVVTTSGSAVGNLLPAVMEASESGVPLVVVSADRPASLVGTQANQTTDQARLFGVHVRANAALASMDADPAMVHATVQRLLHRATGAATRDPGPVQLNVAFAPPLVDERPDEEWPSWRPPIALDYPTFDSPIKLCPKRTVVLAGAADRQTGDNARFVAERFNAPLLAEPSSNARTGDNAIAGYRLLLRQPDLGGRIERVLVFGRPTLSRPETELLSRPDVEVVVVTPRAVWPDPGHRVTLVAPWVEPEEPDDPAWPNQWRTADHVLRNRIDLLLAPERERGEITGLDLAALVVERVTGGQNLVFGASNPIRDADLAPIPEPTQSMGPVAMDGDNEAITFANRGLAGIDGTISTAVGIALGSGRPTTVLLGDITALHDIGGLWLGELERRPSLRLVVLDDRGGAIFHTLEQGGLPHADSFERVFATPHSVDIATVARGYGWDAVEVSDLRELGARLRMPPKGPEVLVVRASRTDRRRIDAALGRL